MRFLKRSIYNAHEMTWEQSLDEIAAKTAIHGPPARRARGRHVVPGEAAGAIQSGVASAVGVRTKIGSVRPEAQARYLS